MEELSDVRTARWRYSKIGFVLQESALINAMTLGENIRLSLVYAARSDKEVGVRFQSIVERLGIEVLLKRKPLECSGGERARAAFARAVLMKPQLILADEPTASLDAESRERLTDLLFELSAESGSTIVAATHDMELARRCDSIITIER
ncbi:MAG: ATP-binding cassette domain-containing protein [Actinomycetaceae bacterium]|nr:ATP-binding cassette domain-containing protein [Actinomycetaceae bacterium]